MRRRIVWSLLAVVALAGGAALAYQWLRVPPLPAGFAYGSGHVEATEVRLAAETGGRVVEQRLVEGQPVRAGDVLLVIDPVTTQDQLSSVQEEAQAIRASVAALEAQIVSWQHHVETTRQQRARIERLVTTQIATARELDSANDAVNQAEGELGRLRAQRASLQAQVSSVESRVRLAQTNVSRTEVKAPQDATVLVRGVEVGEVIQPGQPLALLADLRRIELKVYLAANDAGRVKLGQSAQVRVDAYPDQTFPATVARVDPYAQFTPRDIHVPDERAQMVYGVTLVIDNAEQQLKPGMPADAWIQWDAQAPWPTPLRVPQ
ncbi:HlyD family secretion protein [Tahibacter aquaticus]|uniref:HlyD family secretion protein n=1 Tax=Tahibacter aquaticus TaxID=520092 RepID=A0A4R6YM92_9GAMM|nr:HlyD family efflux transporter periplasmic adaptor subunit [Tahibacter aquaticus]TDR38410.1 HlyD family secretion protein [Tahibacter aquaticus]